MNTTIPLLSDVEIGKQIALFKKYCIERKSLTETETETGTGSNIISYASFEEWLDLHTKEEVNEAISQYIQGIVC